jgi:hypothetical protein
LSVNHPMAARAEDREILYWAKLRWAFIELGERRQMARLDIALAARSVSRGVFEAADHAGRSVVTFRTGRVESLTDPVPWAAAAIAFESYEAPSRTTR